MVKVQDRPKSSPREAEPEALVRERLIDAVVAETVELGYAGLSVERVVKRAQVSRSTFYAHFAGKQAAIEAAHEYRFERFFSRILRASDAQPEWPLKVKVAIGVTLDMAAASPIHARFLALDALAANRELARHAIEGRDRLTRLLAGGRAESPFGASLPPFTEQVLIAGIAGAISARLVTGEAEHLPSLAPQLVQLTLMPYLGLEDAEKVARRPRRAVTDL
jgi:AcrR family transcriptional regulator